MRKADGQFLGLVRLEAGPNAYYRFADDPTPRFNELHVELSFAFGKVFWGNGYATEACRRVIEYVFMDVKIPRLIDGARYENPRSVRLQERLGFRVEDNAHPDYFEYVTNLENDMI